MYLEITDKLAEFAVNTKYTQIPTEVIDFAKYLTLKVVAGTVAGSVHPSGLKMTRVIKNRNLPPDVGVTGTGFKTSLWEGVYLEAFLSHARELEDDRYDGGTSWDITVIPLLLCLAEKLKLSGKALAEALAVGLEVHARTCLFSRGNLGIHIVPGAVGPAVAGAKAMGLDARKMAAAMGLAMSGVPLSTVNFGTDGHYFESSLHSLQGIMAADMAAEGLTSNPDIGTYLRNLLVQDDVVPERMVEDLGKRWFFTEMWIKKYPCCFANHRQIDIVIELMKKNNLTYDQVEAVEVHATPAEAFLDRPQPKTQGDLQFSIQHTLAAAMLDGDVSLEHITDEAITSARYKEPRSRVKMTIDPKKSHEALAEPAGVTIKTKDGRKFTRSRRGVIGSPEEPLTREQFLALYLKFTGGVLPDKQVKETSEAILNMEKLGSVQELRDALTFMGRKKP